MQDAWYYDEGDKIWYYLDNNCKMVRGAKDKPLWKWIDSECCAFNEHGRINCDCITPGGYKVDGSGNWIK
ncbi:hypothetical protein [Clostridium beijerinckii]|uniref:Glucan-binding YG repeat protein n=1 Tax=Clostridium beijerinckii TaxID=1520 RepID=A0A9Q5GIS7_CLOBE|nr:glucan-binding YG repeat protein [Clostridium beijerinckii]MBA2899682.1 glucan-binding YG repeat protein [Clostridium beijerinckii]MBA2909295.1 glucan-binding YG repeat protein [Clostridium beijerinckii]MBA9014868.1 glucan-binding YG repeat protein [Clostridium beijerinckii]MBC2415383.1 hypothetical protein [Clostridium beijerinckii]